MDFFRHGGMGKSGSAAAAPWPPCPTLTDMLWAGTESGTSALLTPADEPRRSAKRSNRGQRGCSRPSRGHRGPPLSRHARPAVLPQHRGRRARLGLAPTPRRLRAKRMPSVAFVSGPPGPTPQRPGRHDQRRFGRDERQPEAGPPRWSCPVLSLDPRRDAVIHSNSAVVGGHGQSGAPLSCHTCLAVLPQRLGRRARLGLAALGGNRKLASARHSDRRLRGCPRLLWGCCWASFSGHACPAVLACCGGRRCGGRVRCGLARVWHVRLPLWLVRRLFCGRGSRGLWLRHRRWVSRDRPGRSMSTRLANNGPRLVP